MTNTNKKNGFTLLETIVAVSILISAVIGPFTLASQTIRAQSVAKNNLIAANLAQEGLELFRNYRANNILKMLKDANDSGDPPDYSIWLDGTAECRNPGGCGADMLDYIQFPGSPPSDPALPGCGALDGCALYIDADGVYSHRPTGTKTNFQRKITVADVTADPPEIKVTVLVTWNDAVGGDQFEVSTHLLNW